MKSVIEQELKTDEKEPSKFNMELADQELLQGHFKVASNASITGDIVTQFKALKHARAMLSERVQKKEEREELKTIQKNIQQSIYNFEIVLKSNLIYFDEMVGDFKFSDRVKNAVFPQQFYLYKNAADNAMDLWEEKMRKHMIVMGLIGIKSKTGLDATSF